MNNRTKAQLGFVILAVIILMFPLLWRTLVQRTYSPLIFGPQSVPKGRVAIVFGAAVLRNGRPSTVLRDRLDTAIQLYTAGVVDRLLMSGDGNSYSNDETSVMQLYAQNRGVAPHDIQIDPGGIRTYDSCYRAKKVYGVDEAVLVTQMFHLPRALFTCNQLGVDAVGVAADQRHYRAQRWYSFRETLATIVALTDVVTRREPQVLGAAISHDSLIRGI
jgi:SanA protein